MSIIIKEFSNETLRKAAEYADNKQNGGNNNGILDQNEERIFTQKAAESFSNPNVVNDYAKLLGYDVQKKDENVSNESNNTKRVNYSKLSYAELNKRYNMLKKINQEVNKSDIYKRNECGGNTMIVTSGFGFMGGITAAAVCAGLKAGALATIGLGLLVPVIACAAPVLYHHLKNEERKDDLKYIFDVDNEEDLRNVVSNIDDINFELKIMEDEIKSKQIENRANSLSQLGK